MKISLTAITTLFLLMIHQLIFADFYNQRNLLIGERAAMMGGAYTGLSEDISGSYYNPAGLAYIPLTSLSMSANIYNYQNYTRSDQNANLDANADRLYLIPTTFGVAFKLSRSWILCFSVFQIDNLKFSAINSSGNSIKYEIDTESTLMGPSLSYKISKEFSFGVSVFYHYSQFKVQSFKDLTVNGVRTLTQVQNQGTSGGITPIAGVKWNYNRELSIGLSYGLETIHTNGKNAYSKSETNATTIKGETIGDMRLPHRLALGVAYEDIRDFTLAFDILYFFDLSYYAPNEVFRTEFSNNTHKENAHFDFSMGGEYYLSKDIVLRSGIYTNMSSATAQNGAEKIDLFGASFGLGYIVGGLSTGIGINCNYGSSSQRYTAGDLASWKRFSLGFIIGGTILFGGDE